MTSPGISRMYFTEIPLESAAMSSLPMVIYADCHTGWAVKIVDIEV